MFSLVPNGPLTCGSRRRVEVGHGFVHIFCLDLLIFFVLFLSTTIGKCHLSISGGDFDKHNGPSFDVNRWVTGDRWGTFTACVVFSPNDLSSNNKH